MKKTEIFLARDVEMDGIINKHYGFYRGPWKPKIRHQGFEVWSDQEAKLGDILQFEVEPVPMNESKLNLLTKDNGESTTYFTERILNDLCSAGKIEAGLYHISIGG